jgi:hypothetical protein
MLGLIATNVPPGKAMDAASALFTKNDWGVEASGAALIKTTLALRTVVEGTAAG